MTASTGTYYSKAWEDHMSWSKLKQNLEGFLSLTLAGKVEYRATGYRYSPDKAGICYISVNKRTCSI